MSSTSFRTVSRSCEYFRSAGFSTSCNELTKMGQLWYNPHGIRYNKHLSSPWGAIYYSVSVRNLNVPEEIFHNSGDLDRTFRSYFSPAVRQTSARSRGLCSNMHHTLSWSHLRNTCSGTDAFPINGNFALQFHADAPCCTWKSNASISINGLLHFFRSMSSAEIILPIFSTGILECFRVNRKKNSLICWKCGLWSHTRRLWSKSWALEIASL